MKFVLICFSALWLVACKFNVNPETAQPAPAPTIAVDPKTMPPQGQDSEVTVSTKGNALVATTIAEAPPCTSENKGALVYEISAKKFFICDATWNEVVLQAAPGKDGKDGVGGKDGANGTNGTNGTNGKDAPSVKLLTKQNPEPAGENCRYGGKRVESGIDANNDSVLSDLESASKVYTCEGNIESIAKENFSKYFQSIGVVISKYKHFMGCETSSAGTGWLVSDVAVTNQHVVEQVFNFSCYGVPADGALTKVELHLPKLSFNADDVLRSGLPHYVGFTPSKDDFDVFDVSQIDRGPTAAANDKADLAFLKIENPNRVALTTSGSVSTNDSQKTLRTGDEVVAIGYSVVQGPRLEMGRVFHIENCEALVRALAAAAYTPTDCVNSLRVNEKTTMISYFGYGDHGGSGSPVFDRFGQVVGVHTWGAPEGQAPFNAAQTSADVNRFLNKPRVWKNLADR